jgi:hypothetical protein
MQAQLILKLPDGTTRTVELDQVIVQTTYATEFITQPNASEPLQTVIVGRIILNGAVVSGSIA